jgi:hypothetical protein
VTTDWLSPIGSGMVAVAGLLFGWASTVRSQRLTSELAREANRHAQALAELSGEQGRRLEQLRADQTGRQRRDLRLEESYVEIATTVINLSAGTPGAGEQDLTRARVLAGLFAAPGVRDAFGSWHERYAKLSFALSRQAAAAADDDQQTPHSTRDLHSPRDMWRRQTTDARLAETDAREHLIATMAAELLS